MQSRRGLPHAGRSAIACLLVLIASALSAQTTPTLAAGARIRVTLPPDSVHPGRLISGFLLRLSGDTITVSRGNLPAETIGLRDGGQMEMDVSRGHGGIGAVVGAGLGIAFVAAAQSCGECEGALPLSAYIGSAGLGALLGYGVGSAIRSARWVPVNPEGLRIVIGPRIAGIAWAL